MRAAEVLQEPGVQARIRKTEERMPTRAEKRAALQAEMERRDRVVAYFELFGEAFGTAEELANEIYPRHEKPDPERKAIAVVIVKTGPTEFVVETDFNVGLSMRQPGGPTDLGFAYRAAKALARQHGLDADHIVTDGFELDARARQRLTEIDEIGTLVMLLDMEPGEAGAEFTRLVAEGVVIEPRELAYLAERDVRPATKEDF